MSVVVKFPDGSSTTINGVAGQSVADRRVDRRSLNTRRIALLVLAVVLVVLAIVVLLIGRRRRRRARAGAPLRGPRARRRDHALATRAPTISVTPLPYASRE